MFDASLEKELTNAFKWLTAIILLDKLVAR